MAVSGTSGTLSSSGLGSGLDVNGLVSKLMAVESQPLAALAKQEAGYQARISAYGSLKGALSALQSSLGGLLNAGGLRTLRTSLADSTIAGVAAGTGAVAGKYSIEVETLAQSHKIASGAFAATSDAVGTGTLTFQFGTLTGTAGTGSFALNADKPAKSVVIAAGQNSLAGIRDAVNAANIGVTATLVNDGGSPGNRLVFTSTDSGAANGLKVVVDDDDTTDTDGAGLSQLAYNPAAGGVMNMAEKVAAQNARLVIDGIAVSKASNVVTDAIQGVTLTLLKTNDNAPTTLTVSSDASSIAGSVQGLVKAYNDLMAAINTATRYDATTKKGSVLTGDAATRGIQAQLRALLGASQSGSGLTYTTLSQVGVSFKADGMLALDTAKLDKAVAADATAVTRLFAAVGTATDSRITVAATGSKSVPGTYGVDVSRIATRGTAVGSAIAGGSLVVAAGSNDTLTATINGVSATVTLAAATYTAATLAAEIQSKLNGSTALVSAGASVSVTASGDALTVESTQYGSTSKVVLGGTVSADAFGTVTTTDGVDVAGTIGSVSATGDGQKLTGLAGSPLEGLQLRVDGGATGARGEVTFTHGIATRLGAALTQMLASNGPLSTDAATRRIEDIADRREAMQLRLEKRQATLLAQFRALDVMMSRMNSTSSYLAQQLANLPGSSRGN